jgi:hypothetical protein
MNRYIWLVNSLPHGLAVAENPSPGVAGAQARRGPSPEEGPKNQAKPAQEQAAPAKRVAAKVQKLAKRLYPQEPRGATSADTESAIDGWCDTISLLA